MPTHKLGVLSRRRVADWSRENGIDVPGFPSGMQPPPSMPSAASPASSRQPLATRPPEPSGPAPVAKVTGVDRWELQQLLVGRNRLPTCQLELGPNPPEITWQSTRCVRVEPPMADFAIVNAESVRDAVGIILRGNTGTSIIEQIMRVQQAGAIGVAIINTSSEKFNPDVVEQELAPEAGGVVVPVVVIRDIDGETIPRRATISVLNSGRARRTRSAAPPAAEPPREPDMPPAGTPTSARQTPGPGPQEPPPRSVQQVARADSSAMDREGVRAMALKLGRELDESDLDRAMSEMGAGYASDGGSMEVSFDAFCQWWAEETVRVRAATTEAGSSPQPMTSHTATHEEISRQMSRTRSPSRPRAASPPPQQSIQADGSVVEAALIQAGIDPETSMQVLRGLERSGKIRPGSSPRRVRPPPQHQQHPAEEQLAAVEDEGGWLTASDEDRKPQRQKKSGRPSKSSSGGARRLRKVQGVKPAVTRRAPEPSSSYSRTAYESTYSSQQALSPTTAFEQLTRGPSAAASPPYSSSRRVLPAQEYSPEQSMLPPTRYPEASGDRDQMPDSFRELSSRYAQDEGGHDGDGRYSGYPVGYGADRAPREQSHEAGRAHSPPAESSRRHRSRRKDKREHRSQRRGGGGGGEEDAGRSRSRRHGDSKSKSHRHRSSRRAARHVMTDSSTVQTPRDQLADAYSDDDDDRGYSQVASEKQDPRVLQQVDELCQSIPEFADMKAHERKLMVEVLQPFTAEPGTRFITQGDEGDAMYILAVGQCKASISKPGQPDQEVMRYKPGDYFGELALMDKAPRAANVDAVTDITCLRIAAREFHRVLGGTTAYSGMERKAAKTRAIKAQVMAQQQSVAMAPPQPTALPPAPAPAPAPLPAAPVAPARVAMQQQPVQMPVQMPVSAPPPAQVQMPVSAAPAPSVATLAANMPPVSPAPAPVARRTPDASPAVPKKAPQHFATGGTPTVMVDGVQMTAAEYISSMGRKLATALMNAAHDEDGHVISDSKITFLIEKMLNQVRQTAVLSVPHPVLSAWSASERGKSARACPACRR